LRRIAKERFDVVDTTHEHGRSTNGLSQSATLLQALLAASADMITVSDRDGRITYASPATERVSGYTVDEFMARHPFDLIHPDDRPRCEAAFLRLLATPGLSLDLQHRVRHKNGTWHWVEGTFTSLFDDPTVNGLVSTIRDITERKRAEEALRASEERYRTLFTSIDEGFCVLEMLFDESGKPVDYRFLETNPVFEQQTGLEQAMGKTARELVPNLEAHWIEIYGDVALTGKSVRFENRAEEMQRWFDVYASRVGGEESRKVTLVFKDITEQKRAEADLRESEERFRAVADLVPDLLWSNDPSGWVNWYNQRWIEYTGQTQEEAQGYGWLDVIHPDDRDICLRNFQTAINTGEPLRHEYRIRETDGVYRWFLVQARPVRDNVGQIVRWYGTATDIHEERMALAEAEAALKIRDQFLSIASHELRTPLTSLIGYTHMLRRTATQGTGNTERMTEKITRQALRLNTLIDQLLDVSRLRQGQFTIERQPVNVAALVAQVVDEFRTTLPPDTKHPIEFSRPTVPIIVAGDTQRLEQVIVNLLSNAVKYSPQGGPVHVRVILTATEMLLQVEDQGIGIPADAQARLFEPFYRANNVGPMASGFGLGLHIVGEIVQRHGGRIEVESTEGEGSTFRVVLPRL
jgi:PAS domain S-box-containing protein